MSPGKALALLGREVREPLESLLAAIHALDAREESDADGAAEIVELAYRVHRILEPLTILAVIETATPREGSRIDVKSLVLRAATAPEAAARFVVRIRGELGTCFGDELRLERGVGLCLRLMSRMVKGKTPLRVHREIHEPAERIVLSVRARAMDLVTLELVKHAARTMDAVVDVDEDCLSIGFQARASVSDRRGSVRCAPVLAFDRNEGEVSAIESPESGLVLIVDREPAARDYMTRVLEREGFEVATASSLEEAYDVAHALKPDAITLDGLLLAREGGGEWVRRFKSDPGIARVPLVLVQCPESDTMGPLAIPDVVKKPIDGGELVATLQRATGSSFSGPSTVLVVRSAKDEGMWQRCLEAIEGRPRRVEVASDVTGARRRLEMATPAAIVIDAHGVEGAVDLVSELRRNERTEHVLMVVIHGRLTRKYKAELARHADARLTRSELNPRSLRAAIAALSGEDARRETDAG